MRLSKILLIVITAFLFISCATSYIDSRTTNYDIYQVISGTVLYPNNLYFPARVRLEISLSEYDDNDSSFKVIVSQSIRNPQRFPVNFILRYDRDDISRSKEYYLSVELFRENEQNPYLQTKLAHLGPLSGSEAVVLELEAIR
jgi:uncharacterized lipoprotein YbaY